MKNIEKKILKRLKKIKYSENEVFAFKQKNGDFEYFKVNPTDVILQIDEKIFKFKEKNLASSLKNNMIKTLIRGEVVFISKNLVLDF